MPISSASFLLVFIFLKSKLEILILIVSRLFSGFERALSYYACITVGEDTQRLSLFHFLAPQSNEQTDKYEHMKTQPSVFQHLTYQERPEAGYLAN